MLNVVTLVGRAGNAPEVRHFESGSMNCTIRMAVDRPTKEKQTDWIPIKAWSKSAETLRDYVKKGDRFGVVGSLEVEEWTDNNGEKRSKIVVNASQVRLMEPKPKDGEQQQQGGGQPANDIFSANPFG